MELLLWRHAEAADTFPDMQRELTATGQKQASTIGAWLKSRLPRGTQVFASPATRTQQTAMALGADFTTRPELGPGATPQSLLKLAGWPDADNSVLIVGHQPTLGEAAALALTGQITYWSIKKGSLWWLSSRVRDGELQATLRAVIPPDLISN
ncbi:MAG TPA: histidine phosphatase family protein [Methylophilaceae bacterium]|jgi:phosphohistidine phosphatase